MCVCVRGGKGGRDGLIYLASTHCVDKDDFELLILLPPTLEYRCEESPSPCQMFCGGGDKAQLSMYIRQSSNHQTHKPHPQP